MILKALVVDDEPFARDDLRELLREHATVEVAWEAGSLQQARNLLHQCVPDVLFLDVQLQDGTGFDLLPDVDERTQIVFVSAYDQYAIRAFEVNALDYLLKPATSERLAQSLERVVRRLAAGPEATGDSDRPPPPALNPDDRILVKDGTKREFVQLADVVAVTSSGGNYTQLRKVDGASLEVRRTIKEWEATLPDEQFVRVHRATIVNVDYLEQVGKDSGGTLTLRIRHMHTPIPVSRRHSRKLSEVLGRRASV